MLGRFGEAIKGRTATATSWSIIGFSASQVTRIVSNLIMARLLAPEMFGVMALVTVIHVTMKMLSDTGTRQVIVQSNRGDEPSFLNTAWSIETLRGVAISIVGVLIAASFALGQSLEWFPENSAFSHPDFPPILAAASLSLAIWGFESTKLATAQRHLDMRRASLIEPFSQLCGSLVMVIVGALTGSIWSLVLGALVSPLVSTLLSHFWLSGARNRFNWDIGAIREFYQLGRWIFLSSLLFIMSTNIDRILLAGMVSATWLGVYSIALNLVLIFEAAAVRMLFSVALGSFSETVRDRPHQLSKTIARLRLPLDLALLFAAGFIFATGPLVVEILYDDRYVDAGWMLQLLSFSLVFARYGAFQMAYLALGQSQLCTIINLVKCCSSIILILVMHAHFGLAGAVAAVSLHSVVPTLLILYLNASRGLNDWRHEICVLPAWGLGYGIGIVTIAATGYLLPSLVL